MIRHRTCAGALALGMAWAGTMATPTLGLAQPYDPGDRPGVLGLGELQPPSTVENGCEKLCFEDLSPCDPPVFKQVDGRCAQRRRRH